ncbi:MAG: hypothetical protein FD123_2503 [Bacteroidetes bacterium]|nr:MAG: hypothetical protein FD123_2503 [Bacteroidota bacterium]
MTRNFFLLAAASVLLSFTSCSNPDGPGKECPDSLELRTRPFPDFGFMPGSVPAGTPVFKLRQDYPATMPDTTKLPDFFKIDFKKDWKQYLLEVQKYCFEGNTGAVEFRVENNRARNWYHMPWQHYGSNGREGIHGLTREAGIKKYQLASEQTYANSGAWAVGFYNELGGWTIGQVWQDRFNPDVSKMAGGFKNGTVLFKLLFISVPADSLPAQVPSLVNPVQWDAYVAPVFNNPYDNRAIMKVTLLQMDIMVRDDRAPAGWVFGNYQYNGKMAKSDPYYNLVPVGVMWGNDPMDTSNTYTTTSFPAAPYYKTNINPNLKEQIINPDTNELPPTHLGWNGRLNGPLDYNYSSCYSCHSTAQSPQVVPLNPNFSSSTPYSPGSAQWMQWFRNLKCGEAFSPGEALSTDFSLQMSGALQNFYTWRDYQDGLFAKNYPSADSGVRMMKNHEGKQKKVFPIQRGE